VSRSIKGKKGIGYEYWSKRPLSNKHGAVPGKETKVTTHKLERRVEKKKAIKEQTKEL
jgi:hypothetical protein